MLDFFNKSRKRWRKNEIRGKIGLMDFLNFGNFENLLNYSVEGKNGDRKKRERSVHFAVTVIRERMERQDVG